MPVMLARNEPLPDRDAQAVAVTQPLTVLLPLVVWDALRQADNVALGQCVGEAVALAASEAPVDSEGLALGEGLPLKMEQDADPPVEDVPAGHGKQLLAPESLKLPALQGAQVALEAAPVAVLAVPAMQGVGAREDKGQKWPAGQMMGTPEGQKKVSGQATHVSLRIR